MKRRPVRPAVVAHQDLGVCPFCARFGALTIAVINNGLSILNIDLSKQLIAKGVIIVAALSFDQFLRRER